MMVPALLFTRYLMNTKVPILSIVLFLLLLYAVYRICLLRALGLVQLMFLTTLITSYKI